MVKGGPRGWGRGEVRGAEKCALLKLDSAWKLYNWNCVWADQWEGNLGCGGGRGKGEVEVCLLSM